MHDFSKMSDAEVISFLVDHQSELDVEGLTVAELQQKRDAGEVVIERDGWGRAVAVVEPEGPKPGAHIWLLWVEPEHRGRGIGRRFVRELLKRHSRVYWATVWCFGAERSRFFQKCGFRVTLWDRSSGLREMQQVR